MSSNPPLSIPDLPTEGSNTSANLALRTKFIGAVEDEWQMYSDHPTDYTVGEPIGFGSSSIVYSATYRSIPPAKPVPCALKVLDLELLPPRSLNLLQRETRLMSLSKHPNVLRVRGTWIEGHKLCIALRLMSKGSAADVMRYGWSGGMEEEVCRCILRQALEGLNYLHINGFIHRDIKAANLLIDDDGTVLLGDLGVAADLSEDVSNHPSSYHSNKSYTTAKAALSQTQPQFHYLSTSPPSSKRTVAFDGLHRIGKRKSFVGTPCWMAPELIQGRQYDSAADIWSFGITAIELTQGRPPKSRDPAKTVLLKTIQEDPPTIDREGGVYKYSRAFKEIVDRCLVKDPAQRPSAEELLQMPFFKGAKKKSYLVGAILRDLPPLTRRQERCVINHGTQTHHSFESWDFASTLNSPGNSIYRRRLDGLGMALLPSEDGSDSESEYDLFDMDDGNEPSHMSQMHVTPSKHDPQILPTCQPVGNDGPPKPHSVALKHQTSSSSSTPSGDSSSLPSSISESVLATPKSQAAIPSEILEKDTIIAPLPPSLYNNGILSASVSVAAPVSIPRPSVNVSVHTPKPIKAPRSPSPPKPSSRRRPATATGAVGPSMLFTHIQQTPPPPVPIPAPNANHGFWNKFRSVRRSSFRAGSVPSPASSPSSSPSSFATRAMSIFGSGNRNDSLTKSQYRQCHDHTPSGHEYLDKKEKSGMSRLADKGKHILARTGSRTFHHVALTRGGQL